MATPAASPAVSSTVGLKNVVIAPLVTDTEAEHTYGELQLMAGAIEASITPENADPDVQYADDVEFDVLYPDPELGEEEAKQSIRDQVYAFMCEKAQNNEVEYIKYIRRD